MLESERDPDVDNTNTDEESPPPGPPPDFETEIEKVFAMFREAEPEKEKKKEIEERPELIIPASVIEKWSKGLHFGLEKVTQAYRECKLEGEYSEKLMFEKLMEEQLVGEGDGPLEEDT